ncbi:MAG: isoleucine--tRNA ligase [Actinomycetota bacterium]|nr:isoleucine--tRNA ligase [Actinomycetota bacterium]
MPPQPDGPRSWPSVSNQPSFPEMEREMLERWRDRAVVAKSLSLRTGGPEWTFYEGPPTANGRPGTHHVESRTFKDVFPRYRTMKGFYVPRRGGWDCHGLPVELEVEKELGLTSKAAIEEYGVAEFNARCRESVTRYVAVWEELTERIAFCVDLDDAYWTMDAAYVDSLWWALKQLWEQGLVFEDYRVAPYCARCGTGLSDAEVAMGYQTVDDPSVYVRFPVTDGRLAGRAALLVWTTTPWTLPSNVAVAAGPDVRYVVACVDGEQLVVAAERREAVLGADAAVVEELTGTELVGLRYEAPFGWATAAGADGAHRVVTADFVATGEGTGLVHLAPAFGADDMEVGRAEGLPVVNPVGADGAFTTGPHAGTFVKDADPALMHELDGAGRLYRRETYTHQYPFCWRCQRPLIYYAKPSWYIRTTARRDELLANNATIDWHPSHIREGRFGNWLENNVDWALSRDRYWGTPLPFWRCTDCDSVTVVGSRAELGERAGRDLVDLDPHRPFVDDVVLACPSCGGEARRVGGVADAWFDSGCMPFAQWGHPHQGKEFERYFPAEFISEAIDQTRGWFYTLLAVSTLLFGRSPYHTVLCLGHIVDEAGVKMSKSKGNVIDPWELIDAWGADALRWLMLAEGNPWVNRRVGHHHLQEITRQFLLTVWNTHYFFLTYAELDGYRLGTDVAPVPARPVMDRWVLAELADTVTTVDDALEAFDISTACRRLETFTDDLSNWYVRRSRRRFWRPAEEDPADKAAAFTTLHTCLATLAGLLAPFTPFLADRLWGDLMVSHDPGAPESVHLSDFPVPAPEWADGDLRRAMAAARRLVELGRQARSEAGVKVRQPLARAVVSMSAEEHAAVAPLLDEVADELNVKAIERVGGALEVVERSLRPNFRAIGPAFQERAPRVAAGLRNLAGDDLDRFVAELASGAGGLGLDGERVVVTAEMVEVVERPRTGWVRASDGSVTVALDTELTRDLEVEGAARELTRAANDIRRRLGLAFNDRVELFVAVTPPELDDDLHRLGWYDVLAREALADHVHRTPGLEPEEVALGDLGTAHVTVVTP